MTDIERANAAAIEEQLHDVNLHIGGTRRSYIVRGAMEERNKLESLLAQGLYGHIVGDVVTLENMDYTGRKMTVTSIEYVREHPFDGEHLIRAHGTLFDGKMEINFEQRYPRFNNNGGRE